MVVKFHFMCSLKRVRKTVSKMMRLQWTSRLDIDALEAKGHWATLEELLEVVGRYFRATRTCWTRARIRQVQFSLWTYCFSLNSSLCICSSRLKDRSQWHISIWLSRWWIKQRLTVGLSIRKRSKQPVNTALILCSWLTLACKCWVVKSITFALRSRRRIAKQARRTKVEKTIFRCNCQIR